MRNERAWPQQCWKSCANGSNIVALRFGDHGTKEMLGVAGWKVWPVSNFAQHAKTSNNMQQGVQKDATCNIQQWCVRLHGAQPVIPNSCTTWRHVVDLFVFCGILASFLDWISLSVTVSDPSPGIFFVCKPTGRSKDPRCENWNCQLLARCLHPQMKIQIVFRKLLQYRHWNCFSLSNKRLNFWLWIVRNC